MFGLATLRDAIGNLSRAFNNLASVVDVAAGQLRQRLALDVHDSQDENALVLEHHPETPVPAPGMPSGDTNGTPAMSPTAPSRNGRKGRAKAVQAGLDPAGDAPGEVKEPLIV